MYRPSRRARNQSRAEASWRCSIGPRPAAAADQNKAVSIGNGTRNGEAVPPDDRAALIRGMVGRLAARFPQHFARPDELDPTVDIVRRLLEAQKAEQAFHRAMDVFKDAPSEQARIVAIGRDMGLTE